MRTEPILVYGGVHGLPGDELVKELREQLPDHQIRHARTPSERRELAPEMRTILAPDIDEELLRVADQLEWFAGMYAGYGHLPMDELEERGVTVTNAAGVHAPNVAEHVLGMLLTFERDLLRAIEQGRKGEWRGFTPDELGGKTTLVVGLGNIGNAICERLAAFDVHTVGIRRSPENGGTADEVHGPDGLEETLATADHVVLACPLTQATRRLIDREALVTMRTDAVLVNVARGEVVDTDALLWALRRNAIAGAALDVTDPEPLPPDHPLWDLGNVLVTPHNAGATPHYYDRLANIIADNVNRARTDEPLRNRVV